MSSKCTLCHLLENDAKPFCGGSEDGKHDFAPAEEAEEEAVDVTLICYTCGKTKAEAKPFCGVSNDGKHEFKALETVSAEVKEKHPHPCKKCPDAWLYEERSRPHMRLKKAAGVSKTCRNADCDDHEGYAKTLVELVKAEGSSQGAVSAKKRPRTAKTVGQTLRVLKRLIADKEADRDEKQQEIDELQACVDGLVDGLDDQE